MKNWMPLNLTVLNYKKTSLILMHNAIFVPGLLHKIVNGANNSKGRPSWYELMVNDDQFSGLVSVGIECDSAFSSYLPLLSKCGILRPIA